MEATVKPAYNRILVEAIPKDHPAYGKKQIIEVMGQDEEIKSILLRVVSVGEAVTKYKAGDIIIKVPFSTGSAVAVHDKRYLCLLEGEILASVELTEEGVIN